MSPPGAVDLYGASFLGCCHPQDAVQEGIGLVGALLLLKLMLLVELRQKAGAIHCQRWSCTQRGHNVTFSPEINRLHSAQKLGSKREMIVRKIQLKQKLLTQLG